MPTLTAGQSATISLPIDGIVTIQPNNGACTYEDPVGTGVGGPFTYQRSFGPVSSAQTVKVNCVTGTCYYEQSTIIRRSPVYFADSSHTELVTADGTPASLDPSEIPALAAPTGSSLVGFTQSGTATAGTVAAKLQQIVSVKDAPFNAKGDGVTDDTAAILSAIASLPANGGRVYFPPSATAYIVSSLITVPANVELYSDSWQSATIQQNGAAYAVQLSASGAGLRNIAISCGVNCIGGVNITTGQAGVGISWAILSNVHIDGTNATSCIGINMDEVYRAKFDYVWVRNVTSGLVLNNNITTFKWYKGNIGVTANTGHAIYANMGASKILEAYFDAVYFESCYGVNPIYFCGSGRAVFTNCGFEQMCENPGATGTITSPIVIAANNPAQIYLHDCQYSGFRFGTQTYSGTCTFLRLNDCPVGVMDNSMLSQTYTVGSNTMYVVQHLQSSGSLTLDSNHFYATGFASSANAETAFVGGIDITNPPATFSAKANRIYTGAGGAIYYSKKTPYAKLLSVVTSSGTTTTLLTTTFGKRSFNVGSGLRIKAFGRRTGAGGAKQVLLGLNAGGLNQFFASASLNTTDSWNCDIVIAFNAYNNAYVGGSYVDGSSGGSSYSTNFTRDTSANDMTLTLTANCAVGTDTMTLDGYVIERF